MIRCMGCMTEIDEEQVTCPYCGYERGTGVKEAYYLLPEKILGQKYIVGKVLGYGGFGVTYIGWDAQLGRKVAIKEYLPSDFATRSYGAEKLTVFSGDATVQFQTGLESFISEAKRLAKFNGIPEIVDIYDCFMENDTGYIIMDFLEGETVKEILAREGKMPFEEARRIMIAVLNGLSQVHKEGIIHRDIAPDNIFINKDGKVKILDFGASRYASAIRSRSLSVILKPGYAPEEQYRSHGNQGPWTDIYAVGATFYRMITGIRPTESIERLADDPLKTPSQLGIAIPQSVENALMNSLNVKAENRIQDAETFCRVLQEQEKMERMQEEKQKEESLKIPLWVKGMAGVAALLVVVVIILFATGKSALFQSVIDGSEGGTALEEEESYMPDISGMSYDNAEVELYDMEVNLVINGMNYSETIEKDRILSQEPQSGEIIKKGATIYVTMSGGNQEIMMPDLSGMKEEKASKLIKAQGLVLNEAEVTEEYSDVVAKGRVISQSIEANERIAVNTQVSFVLSKGSISEETAVLLVPDLTGMSNEEAMACLEQLKEQEGFTYTIGEITREYSAEVEKGRIISQSLLAGIEARTDEVIDLVISDGEETVVVPDVVYLSKEEAREQLEELGLKVEVTTQNSSRVAEGCVISQSEVANEEIAKGTTVKLVVSLGAKDISEGDNSYTVPTENPLPDTSPTPIPSQDTSSDDGIEVLPDDDVEVLPDDGVEVLPDDDVEVLPEG